MTTIDIACTCDDRYVPHTAAMLHSLRWHAPQAALRVHFLAGAQPSPRLRRQLAAFAETLRLDLRWVEVPPALVAGLPGRDYLPPVVWYRIFLPELLPGLDRVLYLDSDVVATDSIEPLWATALDSHYFAAVTNVVPEHFAGRAAQLGLPGAGDYFNLGVALWNLRVMRVEGFTERVLEYARRHLADVRWLEQDCINALYWQRRLPLHPRWNCQNGIYYRSWGIRLLDPEQMREALATPALLHFEGGTFAKPWHFLSTHPMKERYYFHRRRTPWPNVRPEGVTLKNVLKRYLPQPVQHWLRQALRRGAA